MRCRHSAGLWDHPRVCGEKIRVASPRITQRGSPPRVRGKVAERCYTDCACGITPACAGKRTRRLQMRQDERDHPRVCGEKRSLAHHRGGLLGSPPRVRGKVHVQFYERHIPGITPACAGKRLKRSHSIGHFSCILCLFHSVLHRASVSGGSRAGPCAPPCLPAQNAVPV